MHKHRRTKGQALVEFALAATLIFFLLSAAVDLGLIFFSVQALRAAAQDGATFGSYPVVCPEPTRASACNGVADGEVVLDLAEIRKRVRESAGVPGRGFVNLLDLNNDGIDDAGQSGVVNSSIQITNMYDSDDDGDPTNNSATCNSTRMKAGAARCYIRVTIRYNYQFIFPFAPSFANQVTIPVSSIMQVRSTYFSR